MKSHYQDIYAGWKNDPSGFWEKAADAIDWYEPWDQVFDETQGVYGRWFSGARCNTCFNAVDRHVENGRGDQTAIIHDSAITGSVCKLTYGQLLNEVKGLAAVLTDHGVKAGDRVIIYMPMVVEAVVSMLATARIGAIHSVVFGGFAASELASRIDDSTPVAVLAASCGLEPGKVIAYKPLLDEAIALAGHKPKTCVILQRPELICELTAGRDVDYRQEVDRARRAERDIACYPVAATDPLYILYTSGTTGQPKGVVRDNGGHMVAMAWSMRAVYDIHPGEVFWAASDVGWVVGHSYIVYAPLIIGATTIVFEGKPVGTPDAGTFWRIIRDHNIAALFTAPTAFRAIKKEDPDGSHIARYDISCLRTLFLAGERADPETIRWAERNLGVPVIDHWWQTETGWSIAANPVGLGMLPVKYGSPCVAMPGYEISVVDDNSNPVPPGVLGNIVVKLPLPPSCLPTLWNADARFRQAYLEEFPGYYKTADAGILDEDGYLFVLSRTDDIINVAGHRLSTGAMEEVVAEHRDVAECAVIGIADSTKGQVPAGFVVLNAGVDRSNLEIEQEVVSLVRQRIGPVAAFKLAIVVPRLPKTRSGKILRSTMQKIADGEEWIIPATIEDPDALNEIASTLALHGRT